MLNRAIGILGGTFAPIHYGHLRLAIELRETLQLDTVRLVLSARPPHREPPPVAAQRRWQWLRLAVSNCPGLIADDSELQRDALSYTYDTLSRLRQQHPGCPLVLFVGSDAVNALHTWHRWQDVLQLAHLAIVCRPGAPLDLQAPWTASGVAQVHHGVELARQEAGLWLTAKVPPLAISATRIRRLLAAGRSVRGLVPDAVVDTLTPEDIHWLTINEQAETD